MDTDCTCVMGWASIEKQPPCPEHDTTEWLIENMCSGAFLWA